MAAQTAATVRYAEDMSVTFSFTSILDNDTFTAPKGATSVTYQMTGDPTTQASAGTSIEYNAGTGAVIFHPGEDSKGGLLRIFPKG